MKASAPLCSLIGAGLSLLLGKVVVYPGAVGMSLGWPILSSAIT
jgi:hypothetical protein